MPQRSDDKSPEYNSGYSAEGIEVLEFPEAIRKRPAMYIGSTDQRGLHALLECIVGGLLWHYRALHTPLDQVTIRLEQDGSATMTFQGSTPSEMFLEQGPQNLLRDFQMTFRHIPYLMIANSLCERLSVTVRGSGNQWRSFLFEQGILREDGWHHIPPAEECDIWLRLWPDFTIMDPGAFDYEQTQDALRRVRQETRSREQMMKHHDFGLPEKLPFRQRWPLCRVEARKL